MALLPENETAGKAWLLCQRQMRTNPFTGDVLGLDMPGVKAVLDMNGISLDEEEFAKLQLIETTFVEGITEFRRLQQPER